MKFKNSIVEILGQFVVLFVVIVVFEFLTAILIAYNSMGDDTPSLSQMKFTQTLVDIIGFPVSTVIRGFPMEGGTTFWLVANVSIQSLMVMGLIFFLRKIKRKK
ncbi:hypothetical protein [Flagellimonas sp. 2504JD1-5]